MPDKDSEHVLSLITNILNDANPETNYNLTKENLNEALLTLLKGHPDPIEYLRSFKYNKKLIDWTSRPEMKELMERVKYTKLEGIKKEDDFITKNNQRTDEIIRNDRITHDDQINTHETYNTSLFINNNLQLPLKTVIQHKRGGIIHSEALKHITPDDLNETRFKRARTIPISQYGHPSNTSIIKEITEQFSHSDSTENKGKPGNTPNRHNTDTWQFDNTPNRHNTDTYQSDRGNTSETGRGRHLSPRRRGLPYRQMVFPIHELAISFSLLTRKRVDFITHMITRNNLILTGEESGKIRIYEIMLHAKGEEYECPNAQHDYLSDQLFVSDSDDSTKSDSTFDLGRRVKPKKCRTPDSDDSGRLKRVKKRYYDIVERECYSYHSHAINDLNITPCGTYLISIDIDSNLFIYNRYNGHSLTYKFLKIIIVSDYVPNGVIVIEEDGTLHKLHCFDENGRLLTDEYYVGPNDERYCCVPEYKKREMEAYSVNKRSIAERKRKHKQLLTITKRVTDNKGAPENIESTKITEMINTGLLQEHGGSKRGDIPIWQSTNTVLRDIGGVVTTICLSEMGNILLIGGSMPFLSVFGMDEKIDETALYHEILEETAISNGSEDISNGKNVKTGRRNVENKKKQSKNKKEQPNQKSSKLKRLNEMAFTLNDAKYDMKHLQKLVSVTIPLDTDSIPISYVCVSRHRPLIICATVYGYVWAFEFQIGNGTGNWMKNRRNKRLSGNAARDKNIHSDANIQLDSERPPGNAARDKNIHSDANIQLDSERPPGNAARDKNIHSDANIRFDSENGNNKNDQNTIESTGGQSKITEGEAQVNTKTNASIKDTSEPKVEEIEVSYHENKNDDYCWRRTRLTMPSTDMSDTIEKITILSDDRYFIVTSTDGLHVFHNLSYKKTILLTGHVLPHPIFLFFVLYEADTIRIVDLDGNVLQTFSVNAFVNTVTFTQDGKLIILDERNELYVFDTIHPAPVLEENDAPVDIFTDEEARLRFIRENEKTGKSDRKSGGKKEIRSETKPSGKSSGSKSKKDIRSKTKPNGKSSGSKSKSVNGHIKLEANLVPEESDDQYKTSSKKKTGSCKSDDSKKSSGVKKKKDTEKIGYQSRKKLERSIDQTEIIDDSDGFDIPSDISIDENDVITDELLTDGLEIDHKNEHVQRWPKERMHAHCGNISNLHSEATYDPYIEHLLLRTIRGLALSPQKLRHKYLLQNVIVEESVSTEEMARERADGNRMENSVIVSNETANSARHGSSSSMWSSNVSSTDRSSDIISVEVSNNINRRNASRTSINRNAGRSSMSRNNTIRNDQYTDLDVSTNINQSYIDDQAINGNEVSSETDLYDVSEISTESVTDYELTDELYTIEDNLSYFGDDFTSSSSVETASSMTASSSSNDTDKSFYGVEGSSEEKTNNKKRKTFGSRKASYNNKESESKKTYTGKNEPESRKPSDSKSKKASNQNSLVEESMPISIKKSSTTTRTTKKNNQKKQHAVRGKTKNIAKRTRSRVDSDSTMSEPSSSWSSTSSKE